MKTIVCALMMLSGNCMAAETARNWEFPAAGITAVQAQTESGDLKFIPAAGASVKAEQTGEYKADKCEITAEVRGGVVFLAAKTKKAKWFKLGMDGCKAGFSVTAPAGLKLNIKTGAGSVEAGAFTAGAEVVSGAGGVKFAGLAGALDLTSGAGRISGEIYSEAFQCKSGAGTVDLAWTRAPKAGSASIKSGAGTIKLAFPADSKLKISHSSGAGSFNSELASDSAAAFKLDVKTGAGSVDIKKR